MSQCGLFQCLALGHPFDQGPQSGDFTKITFSHFIFISHATDQAFFWLGESLSVFGFLLFHTTPSDNALGQITARELFLPSMYPYTKSRWQIVKTVKNKNLKKHHDQKTLQIFGRQLFWMDVPFAADPLDMNFRKRNIIRERWGKTRETLLQAAAVTQNDPDQSSVFVVKKIYPLDFCRIIVFILAFKKFQEG